MDKWKFAISIYLTAADRTNGSLFIDPLEAINYPFLTYQALCLIQVEFMKQVKAENEKAANKARRGRK